jgi:hypothetical protein
LPCCCAKSRASPFTRPATAALPEATLAAILRDDYHGSEKIRGIRLLIDGARNPIPAGTAAPICFPFLTEICPFKRRLQSTDARESVMP